MEPGDCQTMSPCKKTGQPIISQIQANAPVRLTIQGYSCDWLEANLQQTIARVPQEVLWLLFSNSSDCHEVATVLNVPATMSRPNVDLVV